MERAKLKPHKKPFGSLKEGVKMEITEYRRLLKKHHLCRECKKQDAYTLAGRTYCCECAERGRKAKAEARKDDEKREKMLESKRQQLARYIAERKCVRCGKGLKEKERRLCSICAAIQRQDMRKSRIKRGLPTCRGVNGICWQCNKKPVLEGKKVCAECYAVKLANLAKVRPPSANHPWRLERI